MTCFLCFEYDLPQGERKFLDIGQQIFFFEKKSLSGIKDPAQSQIEIKK